MTRAQPCCDRCRCGADAGADAGAGAGAGASEPNTLTLLSNMAAPALPAPQLRQRQTAAVLRCNPAAPLLTSHRAVAARFPATTARRPEASNRLLAPHVAELRRSASGKLWQATGALALQKWRVFRIVQAEWHALELAMLISLTSLGSSHTLRLPHLSTEAARRFWSSSETPIAPEDPGSGDDSERRTFTPIRLENCREHSVPTRQCRTSCSSQPPVTQSLIRTTQCLEC